MDANDAGDAPSVFTNPVLAQDCPDPGVTRDGDRFVMSCTSSTETGGALPLFTSPDLQTWTQQGFILPTRPAWAIGDFWAPEIHAVGGAAIAYYTARNTDDQLVLGAAHAATMSGPFTDLGAPLLDGGDIGLIDPTAFTDTDGTTYLLWKDDGNAAGDPTPIHAQALRADGLALSSGEPADLITNDLAWEGAVTEAPQLVAHGGYYYLFYSGNSYADDTYAVGVARATSVLGPYTKAAAPILTTGGDWVGPGHCSIVTTRAGETAIVYHAWRADCVGDDGCQRQVLVDLVAWTTDGWPTVP